MTWTIVDSDLPDSPNYTKRIWIFGVNETRPSKVTLAFLDREENPVSLDAGSENILLASSRPMPATWRLYEVVFPAKEVALQIQDGIALLASDGDFAAIDVTITNSSGSQTVQSLQRFYPVIEDPTK